MYGLTASVMNAIVIIESPSFSDPISFIAILAIEINNGVKVTNQNEIPLVINDELRSSNEDSGYSIIQLTNNTYRDGDPDIHNGQILE